MARIKKNEKQNKTSTQDFLLFLTSLMNRPGMYLVNNVEELSLVILGYLAGRKDTDCINLMSKFRDFVNKESKIDKKNDRDWPRIVRFYSASDSHSLVLFRTLFDKFVASEKIIIPESK